MTSPVSPWSKLSAQFIAYEDPIEKDLRFGFVASDRPPIVGGIEPYAFGNEYPEAPTQYTLHKVTLIKSNDMTVTLDKTTALSARIVTRQELDKIQEDLANNTAYFKGPSWYTLPQMVRETRESQRFA